MKRSGSRSRKILERARAPCAPRPVQRRPYSRCWDAPVPLEMPVPRVPLQSPSRRCHSNPPCHHCVGRHPADGERRTANPTKLQQVEVSESVHVEKLFLSVVPAPRSRMTEP